MGLIYLRKEQEKPCPAPGQKKTTKDVRTSPVVILIQDKYRVDHG